MALTGWNYYKTHTITGTASGAQTNYPMRLVVHYGAGTDSGTDVYCNSHCKADFSDLRFTAADGTTLLSYWIESKTDSDNAVVWVKIPSLGASPATLDIQMHYGNSGATPASSSANTFIVGVDAEDGTPASLFANAANKLTIPVYSGSGNQAVHPSVVDFGAGNTWNGYRYWMAFTPYPASDSTKENPSIVASTDGQTWVVPNGVTNPIIPWDGTTTYNADPELVYNDATNELWLYFKYAASASQFSLRAIKSANGVAWTKLDGSAYSTAASTTQIIDFVAAEEVSYSIYKPAGSTAWEMWDVLTSSRVAKRRTSTDGVTWTAASSLVFKDTSGNTLSTFGTWHNAVRYIPSKSKYIGVFSSGKNSSTTNGDILYFGDSSDGLNFTIYPVHVLNRGDGTAWDNALLYKSSINYDPSNDQLTLWYSAQNNGGTWGTGYTSATWTDIYNNINNTFGFTVQKMQSTEGGSFNFYPQASLVFAGSRSLNLSRTAIELIKALTVPQQSSYKFSFYDDGNASSTFMFYLMNIAKNNYNGLGVYTATSTTNYTKRNNAGNSASSIARSVGWHTAEIVCNGASVTYYIDGVPLGTDAAQFTDRAYLWVWKTGNSYGYLDNVVLRPVAPVEPTSTSWSAEQTSGATQTITFNSLAAKTYGAAPFTLTATASSGLPVSYSSSNTAVATVSGSTITIVGAGTTNITASQAGDGTWAAATPVVQALTVNKADQTLSFTGITTKLATADPFPVTATASSGLAVTLSIVSGPASILDGTITLTGTTGTVVVRGTQAGNDNYNAVQADVQFAVVDKLPTATTRGLSLGLRLGL